jgi:diaminopimelate epimerase
MPKNSFYKMNGNGNDFIIIFARDLSFELTKDFIRQICNRGEGIGCDQLILLSESVKSDVKMVIYNQDGTEGSACGNASRCVAWLVSKQKEQNSISIETVNRELICFVDGNNVTVNMGVANFSPISSNIPIEYHDGFIDFSDNNLGLGYYVNVGNDHLIFIVSDINKINAKTDLSSYESHMYFPEHVNVSAIELSNDYIKQVTFERGAGETLSCGTAACAAFAVSRKYKNAIAKVEIQQPGGKLTLTENDAGHLLMAGEIIFEYQDIL